MTRRLAVLATPVGHLALDRSTEGAMLAEWTDDPVAAADRDLAPAETAFVGALTRYVAGEPFDFSEVPTPPGPPFHRACWAACRTIPAGETRTYAELAALAGGSPGSARAAGQAMRRNPLPVVVPCHRVVGTGWFGGYSGATDPDDPSLRRKRWLLAIEREPNRADRVL